MNLGAYIVHRLSPKPKVPEDAISGITLYGDSIAASGIARHLRGHSLYVHDLSQPGDTAQDASIRFAWDHRHTNWVVLQQGTNDLTLGHSPVKYLRRMADFAHLEGRNVVFTGISQRLGMYVTAANYAIQKMADDMGCRYADWGTVPVNCPDAMGLHPDAESIQRLAERVFACVKAI